MVKVELKLQLWAGDVLVAETQDNTLWSDTLERLLKREVTAVASLVKGLRALHSSDVGEG